MTVKEDRISQARHSDRRRAPVDGGVSPAPAERGRGARELHAEPPAGRPEDPPAPTLHAPRLEMLIARLVAKRTSGRIGYWAVFSDEREVSHLTFTTDPAYAALSPENAASRTGAVAAIDRAIERYRAALPSAEAAETTLAPAVPASDPLPPEILVGAPALAVSSAPSEAGAGLPVCPFLGFRDDPSTRCDFPDPANVCHATSAGGATSVAFARRLIAGKAGTRRSQPIAVEHQEVCCLTAAHRSCARYPAG